MFILKLGRLVFSWLAEFFFFFRWKQNERLYILKRICAVKYADKLPEFFSFQYLYHICMTILDLKKKIPVVQDTGEKASCEFL